MNEEQIPVPNNSGALDKQTRDTSNSELMVPSTPFEVLATTDVINGLAASNSKSFGGKVPSALIAGITQQLSNDYHELKFNFKELSEKNEKQRDILEEVKIENAVLKNTINFDRENKHLRNFAITMGTGLIGTGIFLSRSQLDTYAYGAFVVGTLFLLLGWFTGPKEVK